MKHRNLLWITFKKRFSDLLNSSDGILTTQTKQMIMMSPYYYVVIKKHHTVKCPIRRLWRHILMTVFKRSTIFLIIFFFGFYMIIIQHEGLLVCFKKYKFVNWFVLLLFLRYLYKWVLNNLKKFFFYLWKIPIRVQYPGVMAFR